MKEIEVGDYGRTNKIARVIGKDDDNNILLNTQQIVTKAEEKIVKHSKQLIDLVEVGDFVNEMNILHIEDNKLYIEWNNEFDEFTGFLKNKDIKTILTKEQYLANCYKVGGENESN